ncbi:unnamed protein product, partial [Laminaria digitata]
REQGECQHARQLRPRGTYRFKIGRSRSRSAPRHAPIRTTEQSVPRKKCSRNIRLPIMPGLSWTLPVAVGHPQH